MSSPAPLLTVRDLRTEFMTERGRMTAVDGIDFTLDRGEMLGIVGESGCGKSVTSLSIMRLVTEPPGRVSGEIVFEGEDLLAMSDVQIRTIRGNAIGMIYQEPMAALNPVLPIGLQIAEAVELHRGASRSEALARAAEMLRLVGIAAPKQRLAEYPHQLSGGMRQRVMIAMALACDPRLLIADEPTTALDVTIQAQILELIRKLRHELGMAVMLITHDLGVVAEMCERVIVMYASSKRAMCSRSSPTRCIPTRRRCSPRCRASICRVAAWRRSTARCRIRMPGLPAAASRRAARMCRSAAGCSRRPSRRLPRDAALRVFWRVIG